MAHQTPHKIVFHFASSGEKAEEIRPPSNTSFEIDNSNGVIRFSAGTIGLVEDIEVMYSKLEEDTKDDIAGLEQKIEEMAEQIEHLKKAADKLEEVAKKVAEVVNTLTGKITKGNCKASRKKLIKALLTLAESKDLTKKKIKKLLKNGIDPSVVGKLMNEMTAFGNAGRSIAYYIVAGTSESAIQKDGWIEIRSSRHCENKSTQLVNVDLQNVLQKQQQTLQMMGNISKMLYDTAMSIIRKIGG